MIEVEIRGRLTEVEAKKLKTHLKKKGSHIESHSRTMIRLYGHPGFDNNSLKRKVDIRLRDTDGRCEIMVKRIASKNNVARHESSLKFTDTNLDTAKNVLKALGYNKGQQMDRKKDVYRYAGVEWSIVEAPKKIFYYEAEKESKTNKDVDAMRQSIIKEAEALGLTVFKPKEYLAFVAMLGKKVNKLVTW